jgi:GTP-binding protein Era
MTQTEHKCGRVALLGPPNAGKSTLLNAMLDHKVAIVTPKPQTTRNQIIGILTRPGAQVIFMDTPGIHQQRGHLNKLMLQTAWQSMHSAHALVALLDGDLYVRRPEFLERDIGPMRKAIEESTRPVIAALNKVDLFADKGRMLPLLKELHSIWPAAELFPLSALTRDGVQDLAKIIISKLPEGPALYPEDQLSTLPARFMASEIVREKLFLALRQELPYSVAVDIEQWEENDERAVIHAVIYVSRPTHKSMVIGHNGNTIKDIGTKARLEIAGLLGKKTHLELWVKVREDWLEDIGFMHALGLSETTW